MGFAIKVPMFPFHTWLPDAHTQAPTVGSVILAAILLKLGTYGFIRIAIPILPDAAEDWAPWIGLLAVIGIIYGALGCLAQTDMKRLIAFSSVAHMGFVMLGIATLTDFGINAAIFGMVAHGLITGMLFFIAGSVKERYHTLEIRRLGGLLLQAPHLGGSSASAPWPRSACPAWPGSGVSSRPSWRPTTRPRACPWRRSAPTWSSPPSAPCSPPATCCGCSSGRPSASPRTSSPTSTSTTCNVSSTRLDADAHPASSSSACTRTSSSRSPTRPSASPCQAIGQRPVMRDASLAQAPWTQPDLDYHALAPEIVLAGVARAVLLVDLFLDERPKWARRRSPASACSAPPSRSSPLAVATTTRRSMFGGAYVVDDFSLVLKALFLLSGYVVVLLSTNYIEEGDYYQGEYYFLLLSSLLGMVMMARARDLDQHLRRPRVAVDPGLPARRLAQARPEEQRGGVKYYLLGVFASAVMLYGMSLVFGVSRHHAAHRHQRRPGREPATRRSSTLGIVFIVVGFAFKVSAVPFHSWAPDTYEGAPTPDHRVPVGGVEGGRLRRPAAAGLRRLPRPTATCGSRCSGCWPRCR